MGAGVSTRDSAFAVVFALALALALDFPGAPAAAAETTGKTPKGRRTWMCVVFCRGMDAAS
jgi:hypothetical protein